MLVSTTQLQIDVIGELEVLVSHSLLLHAYLPYPAIYNYEPRYL